MDLYPLYIQNNQHLSTFKNNQITLVLIFHTQMRPLISLRFLPASEGDGFDNNTTYHLAIINDFYLEANKLDNYM